MSMSIGAAVDFFNDAKNTLVAVIRDNIVEAARAEGIDSVMFNIWENE
jgi:hypothetical protein